jgi:protein-disulfide isomerase
MRVRRTRVTLRAMSRKTVYVLTAAGACVIAASLIGVSVLLTRGSSTKAAQPVTVTTAAVVSGAVATNNLLTGIPQRGNVLGRADAPVTLYEYVDMQCPYCARFALDSFPSIVRDYVRTGRVRVVFQGLSFVGPDSLTALETALSAGRQNRLWNVVELLFANQGAENSGWVSEDLLRNVGGAVTGLEVESMLADRSSPAVAKARSDAQASATTAGIQGTPSFAVGRTGGVMTVVSSSDEQTLRSALDAALGG